MFTGLIEDVGSILRIERSGKTARLTIRHHIPPSELSPGESIAVDGVCLTLVKIEGASFQADLSPETLGKTTLGTARPGQKVNLERALRLGDRLGGHWVQGHVDGVGTLLGKDPSEEGWALVIEVPEGISQYLVPKGSVAVDGISLTVNECMGSSFSVRIIPHTARMTTLVEKEPGEGLNIECDIIGKYVERLLSHRREATEGRKEGGLDLKFLKEHGFA